MGKVKKKINEIPMHQHKDRYGQVFGAVHPINAIHKNKKTQIYHNNTIYGHAECHRVKTV